MKKLKKFFIICFVFSICVYYFNNILFNDILKEIPASYEKSITKKQQIFLNNVDGINIIEKEMNNFYESKKKERAIVFCFDDQKKLLYCDERNDQHHWIDLTKKGSSTKKKVELDLEKFRSSFDFGILNKRQKNFVFVHNHPGQSGINLPSLVDIETVEVLKNFLIEIEANPLKSMWSKIIEKFSKILKNITGGEINIVGTENIEKNSIWFSMVWSEKENFKNILNFWNLNSWKVLEINEKKYWTKYILNYFDIKRNYTVYGLKEN